MNEIWDKKRSFVYTLSKDVKQNSFYNHTHNASELYMFLRGEAEYVIEGVSYELKPRSFVFVKAMDYHYVNLKASAVYERAVIHFEAGDGFDAIASAITKSFVLSPADGDGIYAVMMKLKNAAQTYDDCDGAAALGCAITDILLQLKYMDLVVKEKKVLSQTACRAAEYINANITQPLNLTSLSSQLYLSPSYLSHTFKKYFKTGVMNYIREKKIRYAVSLISQGVSPTDAFLQCGFNNYSTFYRQYKKVSGSIPSSDKPDT